MAVSLLPCCTQCFAVQAQGSWFKLDGSIATTAQKINACARCHLARYCGRDCQLKDWAAHKGGCLAFERAISPAEINDMVQNVCKPQAGKAVLYLDSEKRLLRKEELPVRGEALWVEVRIEEKKAGYYPYLLCTNFAWPAELSDILNPPNGIHNPMAQVDLGVEMIKKGLYEAAFRMMRERTPKHYAFLQDMFFQQAVPLMDKEGLDREEIVSCAALLGKNRAEVEVLIDPSVAVELPEELQQRIDAATKLPYGKRDLEMVELAKEVMGLGLYDQAFGLVFDWVAYDFMQIIFFRAAADKMIPERVSHEKLVQLAKTIGLTDDKILTEVVGTYAGNGQIPFACQLAQKSSNPDYYLEIVFSALLNKEQKEEARSILALVSADKRRDLKLFLN